MAARPEGVLALFEQALTDQRRTLRPKGCQALQSEDEVHKALNISRAYTKELGVSFCEHAQNFVDQCLVGLGSRQKKVLWREDLVPVKTQVSREARRLQLEFVAVVGIGTGISKETAIGYLAQYKERGWRTVVFKNYGCRLKLDHMQLGTSTKKDVAGLAGYFGEGVKVEINRLLGVGASVKYCTGNVLWTFQYMYAPGHEQPELHIISTRQSDRSDRHTTMTICFPEAAKDKHVSLDLKSYLFFHESYPALTWPLSSTASPYAIAGLEILPHPEHHQHVYVRGMPICVEPRLKGFGLNYLGHGNSYSLLKLGRDRNILDLSLLIKSIPSAAAYLRRDKPAEFPEMVKILYNTIEGHPLSAVQDLMWGDVSRRHFRFDHWTDLVFELHRNFLQIHGVQEFEKVPSDSTQGQRHLELKYLGIQTVQVSTTLYKLFEQAELIPSTDELRQRNAQRLLDSPDATELSPEDQQHWRNELCHLFEPWIQPQKLLFKSLPPGNTEPVRALPEGVYLLDANLLGINNVHKLMQENGADQCRLNNCNCTRMLLIELLQDALIGQRKDVNAAIVRLTVMRRLVDLSETKARNLPPGLLFPDVTPLEGDQQAVKIPGKVGGARSKCFDQTGRKRGRVEHQGPVSQELTANGKQPTVRIRTEEHHVPPFPTDADPIVHHKGLLDMVNGILSGPAHGPLLMQSSRFPSDTEDTVTVTLCKSRSRDELHRSSIKLHGLGNAASCHLYLPVQNARQVTSCLGIPQNQLDGLFTILMSLHMIFQKEGSGLPTFHVYHDRHDGIIAFNSQDEMWYNAAQDVMVQDVAARAEFWYLVICHELAHHFVADHNSEFSNYACKLVLEFGLAFRDVQEELVEAWPFLIG